MLAGIELPRLSGYDCVEVLKARYRQLNHERARLMATMVEVELCGIGPDDELPRTVIPDEFAADEIRAALVLTRRAADAQFWLAHDLLTRLPAVHAAMDAGVLDEPRARVLSDWTTGLDPAAAHAVCSELHDCGITQGRPTGIPTRIADCRAIVELAVPLTTLRTLGDQRGELGAWAHVVTDLLCQLNRGTADQDRDSHRRGPGAALRRYLQARDRSCIMIGCRAEGGWRLHQPHPGHFRWISRLGHTYHRPPPPILEPLPGPLPRSRPPLPVPMDADREGSEIWTEPPPAPEPEPPPEPALSHDTPPF